MFARLALLLLQPEDITDDDTRELRYYDVCDGCRWLALCITAVAWCCWQISAGNLFETHAKQLTYSACTCRLEVSTSDPAARAAALAAAKAAAAAAHAERMEQHEKTIQQFRAVEQRLMA